MKKTPVILLVALLVITACTPATPEAPTAAATSAAPPTAAPATGGATAQAPTAAPATAAPATAAPKFKRVVMGAGELSWARRGWTIETDDAFILMHFNAMECLVAVDLEGNVVPSLAESWKRTDPTTWEFKLQSGVTFHSGEPFNAAAVVNSLKYVISAPTPPRGITSETFASIEAVGDDTVVIRTPTPNAMIPNLLMAANAGILAPSAYPASGSGPINPFKTGTGPYMLVNEVPDQSYTLQKNPNYWGTPATVDEVEVLYIPDNQVRAGMLQTGEIDMDIQVPISHIPVLQADPDITVFEVPQPRTVTLHVNTSRPPFSDIRVRQAVAYAIDKKSIVAAVLEGMGTPAVGPFALSEVWTNPDVTGYPYDPDKAVQLLTEAGYEKNELTLGLWTYPGRADLPPAAVAIQDMLAKIGIVAEVRLAQYAALDKDVLAGNFDMFLQSRSHSMDTYEPIGFLAADYSCTGSYNMDLWCNQEFDSLIAQAEAADDPLVRYDIYRQLQKYLDDNAVGAFLYHTVQVFAYRNKVVASWSVDPVEHVYLPANLEVIGQ